MRRFAAGRNVIPLGAAGGPQRVALSARSRKHCPPRGAPRHHSRPSRSSSASARTPTAPTSSQSSPRLPRGREKPRQFLLIPGHEDPQLETRRRDPPRLPYRREDRGCGEVAEETQGAQLRRFAADIQGMLGVLSIPAHPHHALRRRAPVHAGHAVERPRLPVRAAGDRAGALRDRRVGLQPGRARAAGALRREPHLRRRDAPARQRRHTRRRRRAPSYCL